MNDEWEYLAALEKRLNSLQASLRKIRYEIIEMKQIRSRIDEAQKIAKEIQELLEELKNMRKEVKQLAH